MDRSLPPKPSLAYLRKEAKRLVAAQRSGDTSVCDVLRLHQRFQGQTEAAILAAKVSLQEVQHALALDYGFKGWCELREHVESFDRLSKGAGFDWRRVIGENRPNCRIDRRDLVVENAAGEGAGLHVELGGMSWDNYRLGVDVLVERESSSSKQFPANVQLCPRGTTVFCQLFRGVVILAYWDDKREEHFTHLVDMKLPSELAVGTLHRFEILVRSPRVAILLDGVEFVDKEVPAGAIGMPGLTVNFNSDARVRLRNLRIRFLAPTKRQVEEFNTDSAINWENYKRRQVEAGLRPSMDDNSL